MDGFLRVGKKTGYAAFPVRMANRFPWPGYENIFLHLKKNIVKNQFPAGGDASQPALQFLSLTADSDSI